MLGTGLFALLEPSLLTDFISEVAALKIRQEATGFWSAVTGRETFLHAASYVGQLSDLVK